MTIKRERPHGYARYRLDRCRCYACCYAASEYERNRRRRIAMGTWRVDAEPVRVHLRTLMAHGMGYRRIAAKAGVSDNAVRYILNGSRSSAPPFTIRHEVAQKLLAVRLDPHPRQPVEATGTVRRVQALAALGYTLTDIADRAGISASRLSTITTTHVPHVTRRTAAAIARVYDQLSMVVPTGTSADRARRRARQRGWVPPLAWDDDNIDDPTARPAPDAVKARARARKATA